KALQSQLADALKQRDAHQAAATTAQQKLQQVEAQQKQTAHTLAAIEKRFEESTDENELLLLQLHQAQEELEAFFLQSEAQSRKGAEQQKALQDQLDAATRKLAEQSAEAGKLRSEIERLSKDGGQQQKLALDAKRELAQALKQRDEFSQEVGKQQS